MMEYKGYLGLVEYDDEAGILHGEVINLRDVITFQGETVQELRRAFQESVDDYLAFCIGRNEAPERPYSGTFTVRVPPELHRDAVLQARSRNKKKKQTARNRMGRRCGKRAHKSSRSPPPRGPRF